MSGGEWCYEDSIGPDGEDECPTGGWLTGHPSLVTCEKCIDRFGLERFRQKHFDSPTKSCYDYGCTIDCPVSEAWRRYERA